MLTALFTINYAGSFVLEGFWGYDQMPAGMTLVVDDETGPTEFGRNLSAKSTGVYGADGALLTAERICYNISKTKLSSIENSFGVKDSCFSRLDRGLNHAPVRFIYLSWRGTHEDIVYPKDTDLKMSENYSLNAYLLDRANIYDTTMKLVHAFDARSVLDIVGVYTPEIFLDYDPLMGGTPRTTSSEEWAIKVNRLHAPYDFTQHIVQNLLIDLPQPQNDQLTRPNTCVVRAYAHGLFYNRDKEGFPRVMVMRNGGDYTLDLIRDPDLEREGMNPWRIRKHKSRLAWQDRPAAE